MYTISRIYDFLSGPCLYITIPLCAAGLVRKTLIIMSGRSRGLRFPVFSAEGYTAAGSSASDYIWTDFISPGHDRVLVSASLLFHLAIFIAPFTAAAHAVLFDLAWGFFPPRIAPTITRTFAVAAVIAGIVLVLRRIFVGHVSAVSSWRDYAAMCCVLTPFVTGILAGKLVGPYEVIMVIHCASAHVLILALGWTRLGHMVFFLSGRAAASGLLKGAV